MAGLFQWLGRTYNIYNAGPKHPAKREDAIRIGLLGASQIAPISLIHAARSHPDVIVAAIAARDKERAKTYARKHGIPIVHDTYQDLLDDPSISAVYLPLPNSHHYEWALRALKAGKHVLLEKPSVASTTEANALFNHPLVTAPGAPVLVEAFHHRFHPAYQTLIYHVREHPNAGPIAKARSEQYLWKGMLSMNNMQFTYLLGGGALMDFATYPLNILRGVFDAEPKEVVNVSWRGKDKTKDAQPKPGDEHIDVMIRAEYRFPDGGIGEIIGDMATRTKSGWPSMGWPKTTVECKETCIEDTNLVDGLKHYVQRSVILWNHLQPFIYNRIDITDVHTIKMYHGAVESTWSETKYVKAYAWPQELKSETRRGEEWWTTWRYQLEAFVDRIKGREGSGVWIEHSDSVRQAEAIDRTYEKAGLPPRPTSDFKL